MKTLLRSLTFFLFLISSPNIVFSEGSYFIQNKGQWDRDILFRADLPGGFLFLKEKSLLYVLYDRSQVNAHHKTKPAEQVSNLSNRANPESSAISAHGVEVKFENASSHVTHTAKRSASTVFNYFLGNDPSRWARDVSGFEEIFYQNVYNGIDLRIFIYQSTLKYEFIVHPNADASQIALKYEGATELLLNTDGQTIMTTSVGELKEARPYSFQTNGKINSEIPSRFILSDGRRVTFEFPKGYAKSEELTIDPELIFSTFSGSVSDNWGHTATYDEQGNLYSAGTVFGKNFPATVGAFQAKFAGEVDASILKFSPDGSKLLYATFLGGSSTDIPSSLIVNAKGELLIYGVTSSKNFPISNGAFQSVFGGGYPIEPISGLNLPNGCDIFLAKLNVDGKQLLASTYFGGEGNDGISTEDNVGIQNYGDSFRGEIGLDLSGNVLVASSTNSTKFPLKNPSKASLGGRQDGVLFRISDTFTNLMWSTYLGGKEYDAAFSLKTAKNGDIFVTGITQSSDLPVQLTSFQPKINGVEDAFVMRFSNDQLVATTYLGTNKADGAYLLDLDPSGNVVVFGLSKGIYPVSSGVYSSAKSCQFIHALSADLSQSIFSTVIGSGRGTPDISPTAFLVSECGNIYIAGWGGVVNAYNDNNTESSTNGLPVTNDAIQPRTNGSNFYIAILEEGAKSLLYATYFGSQDRTGLAQGDHVDGGTSRFDKNGMIYHASCACGGSFFPVTPQAWSTMNKSSNCNNAAFKIDIDRLKANFDIYDGIKKDVTKGCAPLALSFLNTSEGGVDYLWQVNGNTISRDGEQASYVFNVPGEYTVVLKAYNRLSCLREDVVQKKIIVESLNAQIKPDTTVCENTSVKLWATGGTQYKWTPATGLDNPLIASPTIMNLKQTAEYTVEISNVTGCKVSKKVKITIESKADFLVMPDVEICSGAATLLNASGEATEFHWLANATLQATIGNSITVKPTSTTTYVVEGVYPDGCRPIRQITVKVDQSFAPFFDIKKLDAGCNEPVKYNLSNKTANAQQFSWDFGNGEVSTEKDILNLAYDKEGEYMLTLTSYNSAGCSLSVTKKLVADPPFILSNVITPNGDGKNDYFIIPVANSRLEVFNRWGRSVFKVNEYKNEWGKGVSNGTYYYTVDTPAGSHCKGWVEVLE